MPEGMSRVKYTGVMTPVEQYSSQTALASMTYGSAIALDPERKRLGLPEAKTPPLVQGKSGGGGGGVLGWLLGSGRSSDGDAVAAVDARVPDEGKSKRPAAASSTTSPTGGTTSLGKRGSSSAGSLARNYWRSGKEWYDKGRYEQADKALAKVIEISPNSPDAPNARRLLANIRLLRGKLKVKSRAEKAAAVAVKQQISADNADDLTRQTELIEEGQQAAKKGDAKRAQQMFQAAQVLGDKLVAKGENEVEQRARLRQARQQLEKVRETSSRTLHKGIRQIKKLRQSGRVSEAGVLAEQLAKDAEVLSNSGAVEITREFQKEREQLAIESAKDALKRSGRGWGRNGQAGQWRGQQLVQTEDEGRPDHSIPIVRDQSRLRPDRPEGPGQTDATAIRPGDNLIELNTNPTAPNAPGAPDLRNLSVGGIQVGAGLPAQPREAVNVYKVGDLVTALSDDMDKDGLENIKSQEEQRNKNTSELGRQVQSLLSNGKVRITTYDGQRALQVTGGAREQEAVSKLIRGLRRARGPQVQIGANIALQEGLKQQTDEVSLYDTTNSGTQGVRTATISGGTVLDVEGSAHADSRYVTTTNGQPGTTDGTTVNNRSGIVKVDPNLQKFIDKNYAWQSKSSKAPGFSLGTRANAWGITRRPDASNSPLWRKAIEDEKLDAAELARKLRFNRWQKTQVASLNLNVDSAAANSLGVNFHKGNNDVSFTVVDEAQFRTLMELDAANNASGSNPGAVDTNETRQDTIVGTDALLANAMTTNVTYSRDTGNTLDINDNPVSLSHDRYVLIDNGGYLTAVRAGEMRHWSEAAEQIEFVKAPQTIEIPQVGEPVKLEKTLVKPGDEMVVRFDYRWEGR